MVLLSQVSGSRSISGAALGAIGESRTHSIIHTCMQIIQDFNQTIETCITVDFSSKHTVDLKIKTIYACLLLCVLQKTVIYGGCMDVLKE